MHSHLCGSPHGLHHPAAGVAASGSGRQPAVAPPPPASRLSSREASRALPAGSCPSKPRLSSRRQRGGLCAATLEAPTRTATSGPSPTPRSIANQHLDASLVDQVVYAKFSWPSVLKGSEVYIWGASSRRCRPLGGVGWGTGGGRGRGAGCGATRMPAQPSAYIRDN